MGLALSRHLLIAGFPLQRVKELMDWVLSYHLPIVGFLLPRLCTPMI